MGSIPLVYPVCSYSVYPAVYMYLSCPRTTGSEREVLTIRATSGRAPAAGTIPAGPPRRLVTHAVYNVGGGDRRSLPRPGSTIEKAIFNRRAAGEPARWSLHGAATRDAGTAPLATPGHATRRESAIHDAKKVTTLKRRSDPAGRVDGASRRGAAGGARRGAPAYKSNRRRRCSSRNGLCSSGCGSLHERLIAVADVADSRCSIVRIVDSYSKNGPLRPLGLG